MRFHSQYGNYNALFGRIEYGARTGTSYSNTVTENVTAADALVMSDVPATPATRQLPVRSENRSF